MSYRLSMFETPISAKRPITCRRCGYAGLYWHDHKLHHWSCPTDDAKPQFVLHRCGFDSRGNPRALGGSIPPRPCFEHSEPHCILCGDSAKASNA